MKPNLLITIGDSWTEGTGCYNPIDLSNISISTNFNKFRASKELFELQKKNSNRFHENGWPNRLGKKLGFDKVINLSRMGASNSGLVKLFLEFLEKYNLENYNVFVIWMMTEPSRFSFYINGEIKNFIVNTGEFSNSYYKMLGDEDRDTILEQIFYIKTMENICGNNNFNLLITYWSTTAMNLYRIYKSKYYLTPRYQLPIPLPAPTHIEKNKSSKYYSYICNHPNELGYEKISNTIASLIEKNHPHYIVNQSKDDIEWEWL